MSWASEVISKQDEETRLWMANTLKQWQTEVHKWEMKYQEGIKSLEEKLISQQDTISILQEQVKSGIGAHKVNYHPPRS